jgi:hypothetical protein
VEQHPNFFGESLVGELLDRDDGGRHWCVAGVAFRFGKDARALFIMLFFFTKRRDPSGFSENLKMLFPAKNKNRKYLHK